MEIKELKQKMATAFEELKTRVEQSEAEQEKYGEAFAETKQEIERIQDDLDQIQVKLDRARVNNTGGDRKGSEPTEETKAFLKWARHGEKGMEPQEHKLLQRGDEQQAGVLVPEPVATELVSKITEISPVRQFASVRQTSTDSWVGWRKTQNTAAQWVGETEARPDTQDPAFAKVRIPVHELFAKTKIGLQQLEDTAFDLEGDLQADMREQFAQGEGAAFVSGNGVGRPLGLLESIGADADKEIEEVTGDGSGALDENDVFKLQGELKAAHQQNARLYFNRRTLRDFRLLKDGNGQFLFRPLEEGAADTIAGFPFTLLEDLPDSGAAGNNSVLLGDMSRAYRVIDRIGISVQRDPFSDADNGTVIFRARMRVGGHVWLPEALKALAVG